MNNRARAVLFLLCSGAARLWAREPTSQDYDVWHAIMRPQDRRGTTYVWHLVEPVSVFYRGNPESALSSFPEARPVRGAWETPAAELDFHKFRYAAQRARGRFATSNGVKLLDEATLLEIAAKTPKPTWLMHPRLLPGADAIYRLSWPAYREDGRAAFIICQVCTNWWGSVIEYQVDKDALSGRWRQGRMGRRDLTRWKDGKWFVDD